MDPITIAAALNLIGILLTGIQKAHAAGQPALPEVESARFRSLTAELDADIARLENGLRQSSGS